MSSQSIHIDVVKSSGPRRADVTDWGDPVAMKRSFLGLRRSIAARRSPAKRRHSPRPDRIPAVDNLAVEVDDACISQQTDRRRSIEIRPQTSKVAQTRQTRRAVDATWLPGTAHLVRTANAPNRQRAGKKTPARRDLTLPLLEAWLRATA